MNKRPLIWKILTGVFTVLALCCGTLYGLGQLVIRYPAASLWTLVGLWLVTPLVIAIVYGRIRDRLARHNAHVRVEKFQEKDYKSISIYFGMEEKEDPDLLPEKARR